MKPSLATELRYGAPGSRLVRACFFTGAVDDFTGPADDFTGAVDDFTGPAAPAAPVAQVCNL